MRYVLFLVPHFITQTYLLIIICLLTANSNWHVVRMSINQWQPYTKAVEDIVYTLSVSISFAK